MYFIEPGLARIQQALDAWTWIGLDGMRPLSVTSFGSVFLESAGGVWFLDTIEGSLEIVCGSRKELDAILRHDGAKDRYLLAGLVQRATSNGLKLTEGQCFDFKVNPVLGGSIDVENVHITDFVVAVNIAGQIHEQVRHLPPGTKIAKVKIDGRSSDRRPWWKFW